MSLPTQILFFDSENNEIERRFFNVGWVISDEALSGSLNSCFIENKELYNKCDYVFVYGMKFHKNDLQKCKNIKELDQLVHKTIREHNDSLSCNKL